MEHYLSNLKIVQIKDNYYKLNLLDYGVYKKIVFGINNVISPFGIETYKGKDIINIEFTDYGNHNDIYNVYTEINQFEKFISNIGNKQLKYYLPPSLASQISTKKFISCIKTSKDFAPLLRVHIKKHGSHIKTIFYKNNIEDANNDKQYVNPFSINKKMCRFSVSAESIWTTSDSYGILFILNLCEVLN